ncbi:Uncharacterized conserved protein YndB, AHSA1/START domain [Arachidicoccus rhizosphaerae]|uniref:Uncharacterized conserved protein YndB, AHSA1/START domain n=1 Tax=Arachidicoccus rhizosphaerae TaxID=551991 RepID=A0A1H3X9Z7_9BACT|nr:SRPBCC domain-containing protein [Arachidicoccus rhizosphaerae]SDZ96225.1 Uncharacterized conserved protein YndB, AHSA1/START domain [Arachidicoccus rhizosphaerae]
MELKTKIKAEPGEQQLLITRNFDLPVALLFKAFDSAELLGNWMGTQVTILENKPLGKYHFETKDPSGNVVFEASGTIHSIEQDKLIVRTFEMANAPFGAQLEFLNFKALGDSDNQSVLEMQVIYRSKEIRDQMLKLPFASGISKAHDRLEALMREGA